MRVRDGRNHVSTQRACHLTRAREQQSQNLQDSSRSRSAGRVPFRSPSCLYPSISTERIMQAVEQQRRVSQQLEDLRVQQRQRTALLRAAGLKWIIAIYGLFGGLALLALLLLLTQPELLAHTLAALGGAIAFLLTLEESIQQELALIPLSNWLLSGAALLVVGMMGLWLKLMRPPKEA
jgi:hypothetical protein